MLYIILDFYCNIGKMFGEAEVFEGKFSPPPTVPSSRLNPGKAIDVTCFSVQLLTPGNILHV